MDKVEVDINGDGRFDDSWQFDVSEVKSVRWRFEELGPVYSPVVADFPLTTLFAEQYVDRCIEISKAWIGTGRGVEYDRKKRIQNDILSKNLSERLVNSDESMLYYLRIAADRRMFNLKKQYKKRDFWKNRCGADKRGGF